MDRLADTPVCCGTYAEPARGACMKKGLTGPVWRCLGCGTEWPRNDQAHTDGTDEGLGL